MANQLPLLNSISITDTVLTVVQAKSKDSLVHFGTDKNGRDYCAFLGVIGRSPAKGEKLTDKQAERQEVGQWVEVISSVPGVVSIMKAARPGSRLAVQDGRLSIGIIKTDEAGDKEYHSNRLDAFRVKFVGRAPRAA